MNKKVLFGLVAVAVIAAATTMGTIAFFSDKETSKDNSFVAGTIDLKVADTNVSVTQDSTTNPNGWSATDLINEKFFDLSDVKPGDFGSDMIELTVQTNPAYVCMNVNVKEKNENTVTNPETKFGDTTSDVGELQNYVSLKMWADDCNGVIDGNESMLFDGKLLAIGEGGVSAYAGIVNPTTPTAANSKLCIAKKWCVGDFKTDGSCNGSGDQNDAQGDSVKADVSFYAVQTRHNTQPTDCSTFFK